MTIGAFAGGLSWFRAIKNGLSNNYAISASSWAQQYDLLKSYYGNNGLYEDLKQKLIGLNVNTELIKALRNPAYRVVEFYPAKLWPGTLPEALPVVTKNANLEKYLQQLWVWSNWNNEKQAAARTAAMQGDLFIKVATTGTDKQMNRVYMQNLDPSVVTDFTADERSYLEYIRIDVPRWRRNDQGQKQKYYITEIWNKETGIMYGWDQTIGSLASIDAMGTPIVIRTFESMSVDFIPIVWQPFRHIGEERGQAAFTAAIDKIDEVNRQATQLHRILFRYNKPMFVATNEGKDSAGRDLPPPVLSGKDGNKLGLGTDPNSEDVMRLSSTQRIDAMVPSIDFGSHLASIKDMMDDISYDLPEMVYSTLQNRGATSGVAIRYLMEAAIDRLLEARGNMDGALVRAQQMALTIGMAGKLFPNIGDYASGALDHSFASRPVLMVPEFERAQLVQTYTAAGVPLPIAAKRAGWSDQEILDLEAVRAKEEADRQKSMAQSLLDAQTNFDGDSSPQAQMEDNTEDDPEASI